MSKAILEFSIPEESAEFITAVKAGNLQAVISDTLDDLRGRLKYEKHAPPGGYPPEQIELLDELKRELYERIREHNCEELFT